MIGYTIQIKCFFDALPFQDIKHILVLPISLPFFKLDQPSSSGIRIQIKLD